MKKANELPSQEELKKLFYYDNGLRWRVDNNDGGRGAKAGENVVGRPDSGGYAQISISGVRYKLSRLIYQTVYGNLTTALIIDHINRDKTDNRVENLRAITQKHNLRSRSRLSTNSTGVNGVSLQINKQMRSGIEHEDCYYSAHWRDAEGNTKFKRFSFSKYGEEEAFRLACEYRKAMIQSLIEQGEWYDENHGV